MFIKRLDFYSDISVVYSGLDELLKITSWLPENQIGLNRRNSNDNDIWKDAVGSLYNRESNTYNGHESEFNIWNLGSDNYVRQQIELLQDREKFTAGRVRFMRLLPKTGLSVHKDNEVRYHLVLKTNPKSYICTNDVLLESDSDLNIAATCYHIPDDGHWYKVDTRQVHWVYNGGMIERIHLVVCG